MDTIRENMRTIEMRIAEAAEAAGRDPKDVTLIAVTKTRSAEEINQAIEAGATDIGENKVQEILDKFDQIQGPVRWHMIGHLQTNKVKYIIDKVDLIHSVDSLHLAEEIDRRAKQHNKTMDILIQVNSAQEESKFGIGTEETEQLLSDILERCENIRIRGLMCIAPYAEEPEEVAVYFRQVKELYDRFGTVKHERLDLKWLSMGMSNDFEIAIREGSSLVRVGTAIFGPRDYGKQI